MLNNRSKMVIFYQGIYQGCSVAKIRVSRPPPSSIDFLRHCGDRISFIYIYLYIYGKSGETTFLLNLFRIRGFAIYQTDVRFHFRFLSILQRLLRTRSVHLIRVADRFVVSKRNFISLFEQGKFSIEVETLLSI